MKARHIMGAALFLILQILLLPGSDFAQCPKHLDIIILVDVSGSMEFSLDGCSWNAGVPGSPGDPPNPADPTCSGCAGCPNGQHPYPSWQRMFYVQPGLKALPVVADRLFEPYDPVPPKTGGGVSVVRFAIGKFPGDSPDDFTWLEANINGDVNLRPYAKNELLAIVGGLTTRWAGTPIGTAIDGAIQMFTAHPYTGPPPLPPTETDSVIILFTDGKQHGGINVYDSGYGSGSGEGHVAFRDHIDQSLNLTDDERIKIFSLGFGDITGTDSETDFKMLKDISKYFQSFDYTTDFTKLALSTAFSGICGLTLTDPSFLVRPDSAQQHSTYITEYDERLVFVVSWSEPRRDSTVHFTMQTSSGILIDPESAHEHPDMSYDAGETFHMYTLKRPFLEGNIGECKLIVDGSAIPRPEWCSYSILGFSTLQLGDASTPERQPLFAGDQLPLAISLTADDRPVPDAQLTATITGPAKGAGNWFAEYHLTPSQLDSVKSIRLPGHVESFYKKYHYMQHLRRIAIPGKNTWEVSMAYDEAGQVYRGAAPIPTVPGVYRIEVTAAHDPAAERLLFERRLTINHYIGVKPDLDWTHSSLEFERVAEEEDHDIYRARIIPRDRYSNFLKPGKEQNFRFRVENARLTGKSVVDDLEGGYYREIVVSRNVVRPVLHVEYDDFAFQQKVITADPKGDNWRVNPNVTSLHFGAVLPVGGTADSYDAGVLAAVDFSRRINRTWAVVAVVGSNRFAGKGTTPDMEFVSVSGNIRWLPVVKPYFRFYISAGGGVYVPDHGSNKAGYNAGVGLIIPLSPRFDIDFGGGYHRIRMSPDDFQFAGVHGGFQFRF